MPKLLLLSALALMSLGAHPPAEPAAVGDAMLLICGNRSGTAWRISGDRYVTAYHVNGTLRCTMGGRPIHTIQSQPGLDFSVMSTSRGDGRVYEIDCGGFVAGQVYRAVGWAGGEDLLALPVVASGENWTGEIGDDGGRATFHRLRGRVFPGMSGGPVLNREGKVVGIVNAGDWFGLFLSRPLSETTLCSGRV